MNTSKLEMLRFFLVPSAPLLWVGLLVAAPVVCSTEDSEQTASAVFLPAKQDSRQAEIVSERAKARWEALIGGNDTKAYEFETPGFRKMVAQSEYVRSRGGVAVWTGIAVESVRIDDSGQKADVTLLLDYKATPPDGRSYENQRPIRETWLKLENQWWHAQ